jgi:hypothetical protein
MEKAQQASQQEVMFPGSIRISLPPIIHGYLWETSMELFISGIFTTNQALLVGKMLAA